MCFCSWLQLPYGHFRKQTRKAVRGGSELRNKASTTRVDLALHKLSKQLKMVRRSKWRPADAATQKMAYTHARRVLSTNLGLFVDLFVHRFASFFSLFFNVVCGPLCTVSLFFFFFFFLRLCYCHAARMVSRPDKAWLSPRALGPGQYRRVALQWRPGQRRCVHSPGWW